jgi:hypothetical protein
VVQLVASGANTIVQIDTDGFAGAAVARPLVTLLDVGPARIDTLRDLGLGAPAAVAASVKASAKAATLRTMTPARSTVKSK